MDLLSVVDYCEWHFYPALWFEAAGSPHKRVRGWKGYAGASREEEAIMMWVRRLVVGTGFAVAGLAMASGAAGAATCVQTQTLNEPAGCVTPPSVSGSSTKPSTGVLPFTAASSTSTAGTSSSSPGAVAGSSSLPFTGADIDELAVVGVGAVLVGGLLIRRRRHAA
jgi:hypothetical protein